MTIISMILLIIVVMVIVSVSVSSKTRQEETRGEIDGKWNKIGKSLLLFIPLFVTYYMIVAILIIIPLAITDAAGQVGWVFGIIGGMAIAPILAIVTIIKSVWKK